MSQPPTDPAAALARLATIDFARSDMGGVLTTIVGLARETVTPASEVSFTLMSEGRGVTAAFTGDVAVALDEQQYDRGYGPCLDASEAGEVLAITDTGAERRWPAFTRRAIELGVRSSLSVPMPMQGAVTGALNLYAVTPHAFDEAATRAATTFADHAAVAVANARSYESAATLIERMRHAVRTRSLIDQAKGILIGRHAISGEAALDLLILTARQSGRRLDQVAAALVTTAQPGTPKAGEADLVAVIESVRRSREPSSS